MWTIYFLRLVATRLVAGCVLEVNWNGCEINGCANCGGVAGGVLCGFDLNADPEVTNGCCEPKVNGCDMEAGSCDTEVGGCNTEAGGCNTEEGGCDTEAGGCNMETGGRNTKVGGCDTEAGGCCDTEAGGCRDTEAGDFEPEVNGCDPKLNDPIEAFSCDIGVGCCFPKHKRG